jgi:hypothetical protein
VPLGSLDTVGDHRDHDDAATGQIGEGSLADRKTQREDRRRGGEATDVDACS